MGQQTGGPNNELLGSLRDWEVRAAFEIEGANCKIARLRQHCSQFERLAGNWGVNRPPFCSVVLCGIARHRTDAEWHVQAPNPYLGAWTAQARSATKRHPHAPVTVLGAWNEGWEHQIP